MQNPIEYDCVIVYSNKNAHSAADTSYTEGAPFRVPGTHAECNPSYQYFLEYCHEVGLKAAFTTVRDITGTGQFSSVWIFEDGTWKRMQHIATTRVVFDKFSSVNQKNIKPHALLVGSQKSVLLYHNRKVRALFDNKLATHEGLGQYMLPTVAINMGTPKTIQRAKQALQQQVDEHENTNDFSAELVLKDILGGGGDHIYKIHADDRLKKIAAAASDIQFLLQPFIQSGDFGVTEHGGRMDLRVIIGNNRMLQSYIRTAKKGDFRANTKQGGSIDYLDIDQIPEQVMEMISQIQETADLQGALYTLDFMRSENGNLYLVEGNASPGLTWSNPEDERRAKQLMRVIVKQLKVMAQQQEKLHAI